MGIPVYSSMIKPSLTDTIQVTGGSAQVLPLPAITPYYHFISNKITAGAGRSFINQIGALLTASGTTFILTISADLKLAFSQSSGSAKTLTIDQELAWRLGFDVGASHVAGYSYVSPSIASGVPWIAPFRSVYLWCPHRRISSTGPGYFDPLTCAGIRKSAGASAWAPDMTAAFVKNGVQIEAEHRFMGVENLYRAEPNYASSNTHQREDFVTFWQYGPSEGSRILYWRDINVFATTDFVTIPYTPPPHVYVEYYPNDEFRSTPTMELSKPPNLYYRDIRLGFRLTERGEAHYT